jgi:hypothetical protein
MNYRSVVILGRATQVEGRDEKLAALAAFSEQVMPGRWKDLRETTDAELKGTLVLTLPLKEVSAKVRTGPPKDDEVDYALPLWAGVVPLKVTAGNPIDDPRLPKGTEPPDYARNYKR